MLALNDDAHKQNKIAIVLPDSPVLLATVFLRVLGAGEMSVARGIFRCKLCTLSQVLYKHCTNTVQNQCTKHVTHNLQTIFNLHFLEGIELEDGPFVC